MANVLERLYDGYNRRDIDVLFDVVADDFAYRDHAIDLEFHSRAEFLDFLAGSLEAFPTFELKSSFATDSLCAGEVVMRGVHTAESAPDLAGVPFKVHQAVLGNVRGGKLTRIAEYWNYAELIRVD
jgi:ketosteroid isomerase-like protein